jgi:hypothetical protein
VVQPSRFSSTLNTSEPHRTTLGYGRHISCPVNVSGSTIGACIHCHYNEHHRTEHTSTLGCERQSSKNANPSVCTSTAFKHGTEVVRSQTFQPLCITKWLNHQDLHPLQAQVSVIENKSTLGCEKHSSYNTSGPTIGVYIHCRITQPSVYASAAVKHNA